MAILGEDGVIRLRLVDHHALAILLDGWATAYKAALPTGLSVKEPRCICPAHLGIFGSGLHIAYGSSIGKDASLEHQWRFLINATVVASYEERADQRGYVQPTPAIHPFPAKVDMSFLTDLGDDAGRERLNVVAKEVGVSFFM